MRLLCLLLVGVLACWTGVAPDRRSTEPPLVLAPASRPQHATAVGAIPVRTSNDAGGYHDVQPAPLKAAFPVQTPAPAAESPPAVAAEADTAEPAVRAPDDICATLAQAAETHDLPVTFLLRLIWQESRFDPSAVSPVGAQGVAQFMPKTAAAYGLADPFDPAQALPTSARYLDELRRQFGNLGLAAAAYNAGPGRLREWLEKRASLPRETRDYVRVITGRTAESWVGEAAAALEDAVPRRAPCAHLTPDADERGVRPINERQIVTEEVPPVLQRARAAMLEPPKPPKPEVQPVVAATPKRVSPRRNLLKGREVSAQSAKLVKKGRSTLAAGKKISGKGWSAKRVRLAAAER